MTRPVWPPHQVRQELDTLTSQARTRQVMRSLPPTPNVGPGAGNPNLSTLLFQWRSSDGDLASGVSDPHHSRWQATIIGAAIDVATFSSNFTIVVYVNGVAVPGLDSCNMTGSAAQFLCAPLPIRPYSDLVTVDATSPGTGNLGVVVHVELAT